MSGAIPAEERPTLRAAGRFGGLVARGLVAPEDALACLLAAARRSAPRSDPAGRRMRLAHALANSAAATEAARERAARQIRAAIAPLVFDWAPAQRILDAAMAAPGSAALETAEIEALVEAAMLRQLHRMRR